jgi:hypothetical protein
MKGRTTKPLVTCCDIFTLVCRHQKRKLPLSDIPELPVPDSPSHSTNCICGCAVCICIPPRIVTRREQVPPIHVQSPLESDTEEVQEQGQNRNSRYYQLLPNTSHIRQRILTLILSFIGDGSTTNNLSNAIYVLYGCQTLSVTLTRK